MTPLEQDIVILKKYYEGDYLDTEDENIVETLCIVGLMKTGLSLSDMRRTAKTIGLGRTLAETNLETDS